MRRRSDLKVWQMISRLRINLFALGIILSSLFVIACPPPDYPVLFGYEGGWNKSLNLKENNVKMEIKGKITLSGWSDNLHIKIGIEGLDTTEITFIDTTIFSGRSVRWTHYFDDKIKFESQTFRVPANFVSHLERGLNIFFEKDKAIVVIWAIFDNHKSYDDMTKDEFFAYLDMLNGQIHIENIFDEPKLIEVKIDKKLLTRKLRSWVPALQENG